MTWEIVGHERAVDLLQQSIARGRIGHAYLFSGPRGVGKRTLALELARALNCERYGPGVAGASGEPPCGTCRRCRLIAAGTHPEVRVTAVEPPHRVIRVADVESIQTDAALRPGDAFRKLYIIEQAELLHVDAATRLLKTIEEPPSSVVIILTTVDPEATLPTIVSRCQHIRLRPLSRPALATFLAGTHGLAVERAELLAGLAGGSVGVALRLADDDRVLERRTRLLDDLVRLVDAGRVERLSYAKTLGDRWSASPEGVRETLEIWTRWWRDVLLSQRGIGRRIVNLDRRDELERLATKLSAKSVASGLAGARDALLLLDQNVNARLVLDVTALGLPRSERAA